MGKHTIVAFIALFCFVVNLPAQKSKLKKAQKFMESLNYSEAIDMYLKILAKDDLPEIKIDLANAYLKINDYTNANAMLIPQSIISENAEGDQYIYLVNNINENDEATAQRLVITTGKTQGDVIEVLSGLSDNAEIINEGARSVQDGQMVKILK